jgi:ABC-type Fe3+-hydroxamate transport system substrate-binding protein
MTVGGDTFIHDMLQRCGFKNVFAHAGRYPEISVEEIEEVGCNKVFLSSEPFPFKQKHVEELKTQLRGCSIHLVDGEMFSWYGSRLILAGDYFQKLKNQIANGE